MQADAGSLLTHSGALEPRNGHDPFTKAGKTGAMQVIWRELCIIYITVLPIAPFDLPKEKLKSERLARRDDALFCYSVLETDSIAKVTQR